MFSMSPMLQVFFLGVFLFGVQAGSSPTSGDALPSASLRSPYWGDESAYQLPIDERPTIAVVIDPSQSLLPMEAIRGLRMVERFGDRIRLAVVFVGDRAKGPKCVDAAIEQQNLLKVGLKSSPTYLALKDESGDWYEQLGRPVLPHALLIDGEGRIVAREVLLGAFSNEVRRIEGVLDTASPAAAESDGPALPVFLKAVRGVPLRLVDVSLTELPTRERITTRIDAAAIVDRLHAVDPGATREAVRDYCEEGRDFSLVRRFAEAIVERYGEAECPWAKAILDARVAGCVSAYHDDLAAALSVENMSHDLTMRITLTSTLTSRWDDRKVAALQQTASFSPGADAFVTNDKFKTLNAGWGDYVVHNHVEVTMSSGEYPDVTTYPRLVREWDEPVDYFPRNEFAGEDDAFHPNRSPAAVAFRRGLRDQFNRARGTSALPESDDPVVKSVTGTIAGAAGALKNLTQRLTGSDKRIGKPFDGLHVQSWVRGQSQCQVDDAGKLIAPKGRVMLVDFMFVNCPPCRAALPKLSKLHERRGKDGLVVVSVVASWGARGIYQLVEKKKLKHAVAVLAVGEARDNDVTAFPTYLLIDRKGVIRWTGVGGEPDEAMIEKLLKEKP